MSDTLLLALRQLFALLASQIAALAVMLIVTTISEFIARRWH